MKKVNLICIGCPLGCPLTVEMEDNNVISVQGATCKNGENYAIKEVTDPRRIVTSTVPVKNGSLPAVSVKTEKDIPKGKIFRCIEQLKSIELEAPVKIGQIVCADIASTGVAVVATKNIEKVGI